MVNSSDSATVNPTKSLTVSEAKFDPRIKSYILWTGTALCIVTIAGILLLPLWLTLGRMYINRYFDSLHCELKTRALHFKKGVLFQTERTIPLDKIQDLTFKEGPLLRYFGLSTLNIETAGQSVQSASDMSLIGIIDSQNFRKKVLDQRDIVTDIQSPVRLNNAGEDSSQLYPVLKEIHQTLISIEEKLNSRS